MKSCAKESECIITGESNCHKCDIVSINKNYLNLWRLRINCPTSDGTTLEACELISYPSCEDNKCVLKEFSNQFVNCLAETEKMKEDLSLGLGYAKGEIVVNFKEEYSLEEISKFLDKLGMNSTLRTSASSYSSIIDIPSENGYYDTDVWWLCRFKENEVVDNAYVQGT